jgi:hypothetical protein
MPSLGGTRPLVIEEVFLFDGPGLVSRLQERGVRIGVATSVRPMNGNTLVCGPSQPASRDSRLQAAVSALGLAVLPATL